MPTPRHTRFGPVVTALLLVCVAAATVTGLTACWLLPTGDTLCGDGRPDAGRPPAAERPSAPGPPESSVAEALWAADSGTVRALDAASNEVAAQIGLPGGPESTPAVRFPPALLAGDGTLWAYRPDRGVAIIDPVSARVVGEAAIPAATPLAANRPYAGHGALWVAQPGRLWRVLPTGAAASASLPAGFEPAAVAATDRWLWLASGRRLVRVDPATLATTALDELSVPTGISELLGTGRALFAVGWNQHEFWLLDPDSGARLATVGVGGGELVTNLVAAGDDVWASGNCGHVVQVPATAAGRSRSVRISDVSQDLPTAVGLGSLWVCDEVRSELVRVDLRTARVVSRSPVAAADPDDAAFRVVAGATSVWLIDGNLTDGVQRVDPVTGRTVRVVRPSRSPSGLSAVVAARPSRR